MMDVSTAQSGSLRPNVRAITSAPKAATVTRTPKPSSTFRDFSQAAIRLRRAIIRIDPCCRYCRLSRILRARARLGQGRLPKRLMLYIDPPRWGHVAEWLRNGLQSRQKAER